MTIYHVTYELTERRRITVAVKATSAKAAESIVVDHDDPDSLPSVNVDFINGNDIPFIVGVVEAPKK